jgi:hypothetical protein
MTPRTRLRMLGDGGSPRHEASGWMKDPDCRTSVGDRPFRARGSLRPRAGGRYPPLLCGCPWRRRLPRLHARPFLALLGGHRPPRGPLGFHFPLSSFDAPQRACPAQPQQHGTHVQTACRTWPSKRTAFASASLGGRFDPAHRGPAPRRQGKTGSSVSGSPGTQRPAGIPRPYRPEGSHATTPSPASVL